MYSRYPAWPGHAPLPPEKKSTYGGVFCILVLYTIAVAVTGYVLGQQAFDPAEQIRFEARHWELQSNKWKEKVNAYKARYNEQNRMAPGEQETCPICDDCAPPVKCTPKRGVECNVDPCNVGVAPALNGTEDQQNVKDESERIPIEPARDPSGMVRPDGVAIPGDTPATSTASDQAQKDADLQDESPQEEKVKDDVSIPDDHEELFIPPTERIKHNVQNAYDKLLAFIKQPPLKVPGLGMEYRDLGDCPACEVCNPGLDCNQQGVLMRLDAAEREYQERKAHSESSQRGKDLAKTEGAKQHYNMWAHCLESTLPAVSEAYQEAQKARRPSGSG
mmetsp:Transcript_33848/g.74028  ORF Transcript_33848/g.74028 Transcript_33848/m.74028 type:complete len:333 (+) Transcript_33848:204-1202(+)